MARRSLHSFPRPAAHVRQGAHAARATASSLDLEDAVPPDSSAASADRARWLGRDFGGRERWVRMNPIATALGRDDLAETIARRPTGYVVAEAAPRG